MARGLALLILIRMEAVETATMLISSAALGENLGLSFTAYHGCVNGLNIKYTTRRGTPYLEFRPLGVHIDSRT